MSAAKSKALASSSRRRARSRTMPASLEPDVPRYLQMLTLTALAGTLRVPIGSSLAQIYLGAARALIDAARRLEVAEQKGSH